MPPWAWVVVVCVVLSVMGLLVDRRARRIREGLVVPADRVGRGGDRPDAAGRLNPHSAGGLGTGGGPGGGAGSGFSGGGGGEA
ncbi:hypothetical protein ACFV4N_39130 [Actinosynnema sp. NPDC059797]